jgi:catechol 2,3-dioxygenase-like lactoylglutathione lyase family enzyme
VTLPAVQIEALHHVQLAMPAGGEGRAREFYADLLGIPEVPKPAAAAKRGGCWFERGQLRVHLGVEEDFRPARKAHPAFLVSDLAMLLVRLRGAGYMCQPEADLAGLPRACTADPFGNRIELLGCTG